MGFLFSFLSGFSSLLKSQRSDLKPLPQCLGARLLFTKWVTWTHGREEKFPATHFCAVLKAVQEETPWRRDIMKALGSGMLLLVAPLGLFVHPLPCLGQAATAASVLHPGSIPTGKACHAGQKGTRRTTQLHAHSWPSRNALTAREKSLIPLRALEDQLSWC